MVSKKSVKVYSPGGGGIGSVVVGSGVGGSGVGGVDLAVVVVDSGISGVDLIVVVGLVVVVVDSGVGGVGSVGCKLLIFKKIFSNKCFAKNLNIITVELN
jgi:hypothetical protein